MNAILVERDYKGYYERFALTPEEFKERFPETAAKGNWPIQEADTDTISPLVHIWYAPCIVGDEAWFRHFSNMEWGLPESDIESGNLAYVRSDLMGELKAYVPVVDGHLVKTSKEVSGTCYKVTLESMCDGETQVCMWVDAQNPDAAMEKANDLVSDNEYRAVRAEVDEDRADKFQEEDYELPEAFLSLGGEISSLQDEVNGMFGYDYDPELVALKERQLFMKECQLEAALNGHPFSDERAMRSISLAKDLSQDIIKQLDNKENSTSYGEPQAFVSLDNGRTIEVILEQEGLAESEFHYRALLHCNDSEPNNQSSNGVLNDLSTEGLDKVDITDLVLAMLATNEMCPVAENNAPAIENSNNAGKKPSLTEQLHSASSRAGAQVSAQTKTINDELSH